MFSHTLTHSPPPVALPPLNTQTGSTHVVQLVVQATRVTHWLAVLVASPQRGGGGLAVGAAGARPPLGRLWGDMVSAT